LEREGAARGIGRSFFGGGGERGFTAGEFGSDLSGERAFAAGVT
jgi:hypothetical protein